MTDINQIKQAMNQALIQFHIAACTELPNNITNADITINYTSRAAEFTLEWNGATIETKMLNSKLHRKAEQMYESQGTPKDIHADTFPEKKETSRKSEEVGTGSVKDIIRNR